MTRATVFGPPRPRRAAVLRTCLRFSTSSVPARAHSPGIQMILIPRPVPDRPPPPSQLARLPVFSRAALHCFLSACAFFGPKSSSFFIDPVRGVMMPPNTSGSGTRGPRRGAGGAARWGHLNLPRDAGNHHRTDRFFIFLSYISTIVG